MPPARSRLVTVAALDTAHPIIASQLVEATFHFCSAINGQIESLHLDQHE